MIMHQTKLIFLISCDFAKSLPRSRPLRATLTIKMPNTLINLLDLHKIDVLANNFQPKFFLYSGYDLIS